MFHRYHTSAFSSCYTCECQPRISTCLGFVGNFMTVQVSDVSYDKKAIIAFMPLILSAELSRQGDLLVPKHKTSGPACLCRPCDLVHSESTYM